MAGSEVTQAAELWAKGDANGDGRVNLGDFGMILRHVKGTGTLADYALKCADANGDGRVNLGDFGMVLRHVKGTGNLW